MSCAGKYLSGSRHDRKSTTLQGHCLDSNIINATHHYWWA